jgi:N-acetylgalactosamine kinase
MDDNRGIFERTLVVLLAAGKGTRMGGDVVKVCFEIDGIPAITRQISMFKRLRLNRFLIVVGDRADQVLQAVGREQPAAMYVHQSPQLGTGHAAKVAADALAAIDYRDHVLLSMGDKYIEDEAIVALVDGHVKQQADMSLLTIPKTQFTEASAGRVFVDEQGQALDIIEQIDIARQMIADDLRVALERGEQLDASAILSVVEQHIHRPDKRQSAVADLLALAGNGKQLNRGKLEEILKTDKYNLRIGGKTYPGRQIEKMAAGVNPSLYLARAEVFYQGVGMIRNDNAQGEYYVTDMVRLLAAARGADGRPRYRVRAVAVERPDWVQSFNSPDELLVIHDYVRRKRQHGRQSPSIVARPQLKPSQYASAEQWLARLDVSRPATRRWLRTIYGGDDELQRRKIRDIRGVVECFGKRFGMDQKLCIVRAPGRVNLMGRHVDHRGGMTNFLAIDRETIAAVGPRDDDRVLAVNTRPATYKPVDFRISELLGGLGWRDWIDFVNSDWVRNIVYAMAGNWGNYIKAAMLRLQHRFQDVRVRGLNMALTGDVPVAAGLSSSSTIVVAALQSAIALNNFDLTSQQFIDLCGEGEWFVGSRGGAGDHAAIYLGQRGKIAQVGYLPFRVEKMIDAPEDYQVVIANSHVKAAKSAAARDQFNARIADYNLGLALLKQRCGEIAGAVQHLRDIDPAKLGRPTSEIYRWLLRVPETMTRNDFRAMLSKEHEALMETSFATHAEPPAYHPRGVLLFGIAEVLRSRMCVELLESGRIGEFGELMKISHDGDRVSRPGADGQYHITETDCSDERIGQLIADLRSENPRRVLRAQLFMQPGAYACSTPEIDQMVDIAAGVPGVAGAQIAGAGLGGCIMALVRRECVGALRKALAAGYYRPRGLEPAAIPCAAVEGAGLVEA